MLLCCRDDIVEALLFDFEIGPESLQLTAFYLGLLSVFVPPVELESQKDSDDDHDDIKCDGEPVLSTEMFSKAADQHG